MPNLSRTYELYLEAWKRILAGDFLNDDNNVKFEYTLKSLLRTQYKRVVLKDISSNLNKLFREFADLENPPPFLYILIGLKDPYLNMRIQELAIMDWISQKASEPTTYQMLNIISTMDHKNININNFVLAAIKYMRETMDHEMLKAFAFMIINQHSQYLKPVLIKFASFSDQSILKDFVHMSGRKAVIELTGIMRPADVQKLLETKPPSVEKKGLK